MDPVLSLREVSLSFPRGRRHVLGVLADVALDLHVGECVMVLAQRSQGKTSLLRVAAGVERPDRGSVMFTGEDMWRLSDRRRSRLLGSQIALVERSTPHLDVPVLTGIALPLLNGCSRRDAYARAKSALAHVGASECARQHWGELADSERALVALAHGIAREPRLLLVDDLAATLGIEEHAHIGELLGRLGAEREIAVLVCATDSGPTPNADRVGSLSGGRLVLAPRAPADETNVVDFPGERRRRASS
jgi:predicted ABC-type transport system involved in lysophospholipase L1 biosynthesis ATPase subunit